MSLIDQIPGYADAVRVEQRNRELAFMAEPPPVCGVRVRHLNLRHHWILVQCGNRFLVGGRVRAIDVAFALWVLSPSYTPNDAAKRDAFIAEHCRAAVSLEWLGEATRAIRGYMDGALQDWPSPTSDGEKQYVAAPAYLVDLFAMEYGWTADYVMEAPMGLLIQMVRRIQMRKNPKVPLFNLSDRVLSAHLLGRPAKEGRN